MPLRQSDVSCASLPSRRPARPSRRCRRQVLSVCLAGAVGDLFLHFFFASFLSCPCSLSCRSASKSSCRGCRCSCCRRPSLPCLTWTWTSCQRGRLALASPVEAAAKRACHFLRGCLSAAGRFAPSLPSSSAESFGACCWVTATFTTLQERGSQFKLTCLRPASFGAQSTSSDLQQGTSSCEQGGLKNVFGRVHQAESF